MNLTKKIKPNFLKLDALFFVVVVVAVLVFFRCLVHARACDGICCAVDLDLGCC